jgi:hypothetical protein
MIQLLKELKNWFYRQRVKNTLQRIRRRLVMSNERLFAADNSIQIINKRIKQIKPHIFEEYNQVFNFTSEFSFLSSDYATRNIQKYLSNIIIETECGEQRINFKWIEGISASKSDLPENYHKWDDFFQFGKYAYEIHLGQYRKLDTKQDWQTHYECLVQFFEQLQENRRGIYSINYQSWCGRYYIANSGVSRRSAACAYMAKQGDPNFDKSIAFRVKQETIDWELVKKIEKISESYIIMASEEFHDGMKKLIAETEVPVGICISRTNRAQHQDYDVRLYLLLHENFLEEAMSTDHFLKAYLYQRRMLKPQLDSLKQRGLSISLPQYIKFITKFWQTDSKFDNRDRH